MSSAFHELTPRTRQLHSVERWTGTAVQPPEQAVALHATALEAKAISFVKANVFTAPAACDRHSGVVAAAAAPVVDVQADDFDAKALLFLRESQPTKTKSEETRTGDKYATDVFKVWYLANLHHPYLSIAARTVLARETRKSEIQVQNWIKNTRKRYWLKQQQQQRLGQADEA